jgi:hypothetical protein
MNSIKKHLAILKPSDPIDWLLIALIVYSIVNCF